MEQAVAALTETVAHTVAVEEAIRVVVAEEDIQVVVDQITEVVVVVIPMVVVVEVLADMDLGHPSDLAMLSVSIDVCALFAQHYYGFLYLAPLPPNLPVYKEFYQEHPKTAARSQFEIREWQEKHNIIFRGNNPLNPILDFAELETLPEALMQSIRKQGFTAPTVIQSQAWPYALSGRDFVGIAQTGSGKTMGYCLPALVHVDGNHHRRAYGPSVLVLAPTRELAQQIKDSVNQFKTARSVCIFGGASKMGQRREMERTDPSIIIACPGRLIDFVEEGSISLQNITYLVLDEADRMLDMGFEPQIRKIVEKIPKDRQTLMWSATWPKEVRRLAEDFLVNYVQVNIGSVNLAANHNITQIVDVCTELEKFDKLYKLLSSVNANSQENKTIIFAETKRKVDELSYQMKSGGWRVGALHGDKPQNERDWVLNGKFARFAIQCAPFTHCSDSTCLFGLVLSFMHVG